MKLGRFSKESLRARKNVGRTQSYRGESLFLEGGVRLANRAGFKLVLFRVESSAARSVTRRDRLLKHMKHSKSS